MRHKRVRNFATGDIIRATVPKGKYAGQHCGRVAVRASGSFDIQTPSGVAQGVSSKHCLLVQRNDGYHYYTRLLPGINARIISVGVIR